MNMKYARNWAVKPSAFRDAESSEIESYPRLDSENYLIK